jgi:hypothetical protein
LYLIPLIFSVLLASHSKFTRRHTHTLYLQRSPALDLSLLHFPPTVYCDHNNCFFFITFPATNNQRVDEELERQDRSDRSCCRDYKDGVAWCTWSCLTVNEDTLLQHWKEGNHTSGNLYKRRAGREDNANSGPSKSYPTRTYHAIEEYQKSRGVAALAAAESQAETIIDIGSSIRLLTGKSIPAPRAAQGWAGLEKMSASKKQVAVTEFIYMLYKHGRDYPNRKVSSENAARFMIQFGKHATDDLSFLGPSYDAYFTPRTAPQAVFKASEHLSARKFKEEFGKDIFALEKRHEKSGEKERETEREANELLYLQKISTTLRREQAGNTIPQEERCFSMKCSLCERERIFPPSAACYEFANGFTADNKFTCSANTFDRRMNSCEAPAIGARALLIPPTKLAKMIPQPPGKSFFNRGRLEKVTSETRLTDLDGIYSSLGKIFWKKLIIEYPLAKDFARATLQDAIKAIRETGKKELHIEAIELVRQTLRGHFKMK